MARLVSLLYRQAKPVQGCQLRPVEYANCEQLITVNLALANLPKEGPAYDLPIAVGLLMASEQLRSDVAHAFIIGELSLDGVVRHTNGVLPMAALARQCKIQTLFDPTFRPT